VVGRKDTQNPEQVRAEITQSFEQAITVDDDE
jgi:hypothetical protein